MAIAEHPEEMTEAGQKIHITTDAIIRDPDREVTKGGEENIIQSKDTRATTTPVLHLKETKMMTIDATEEMKSVHLSLPKNLSRISPKRTC
jgi:hypothetical protein